MRDSRLYLESYLPGLAAAVRKLMEAEE